ncbi:LysR family transcriptional regulator [Companilactobacillus huachuanensis]|uniref:LysR family transcriptional regulator n=1 Tax=Companilactobacillus huachuanensis TaxID=2559914 RepID=A0ABW1RPK8_9LACO|nr:LysR family transcriptional regulator [Companilactobacillus huachuanensis]
MDLNKLKAFVNLSKTLNYTETAESLFTTQGNISKQILSLEKDFDVSLFKRAHRKIELTEQGKLILPYAQKIVNDYTELTDALGNYQQVHNMTINMHTIPTMPNYQSFGIVSQFLHDYPAVQMQLKEEESYHLITSLKSGKCEVIFARTFEFDEPKLERIVMEDDKFVAMVPNNHALATQNKLDLADLKDEKFLILGNSTNLYLPVLELCQRAGFNPDVFYEGTRVDLIMKMVQNNMGVSVMAAKTAKQFENQAVSIIPLTANILNKLCFIRVKGQHSKANNLFWKYIQEQVGNDGGQANSRIIN